LNGYSDAFAWPMRDPQWISKVLLMGLISLIPIVGQIVLLGWMLAALDYLRAGRYELPPPGFSYIGRGFGLWVVELVYGLFIALVFVVVLIVGGGLQAAGSSSGGSGALSALAGLIFAVGYLAALAFAVCYGLLRPVVILRTDLGGIGGGLNVAQVVSDARRLLGPTLLAGLLAYVAFLIAGAGAILCYVGIILTAGYGYAVVAGIVRYYEQQLSGQGAAPQPPAGSNLPNYPTYPTSN
jgi:hypothetical protein